MRSPTIDTGAACAALGIPRQRVVWDRRTTVPASTQFGMWAPWPKHEVQVSSFFFGPRANDYAVRVLDRQLERRHANLDGDDLLRWVVGHEIGHRWQDLTTTDRRAHVQDINQAPWSDYATLPHEVEADLIAAQIYGMIKINGKAH